MWGHFVIFFSTGGWTYTDKALIAAKNQLFQKANGARPGVSKVCYKKKKQNYNHVHTWCPSTVPDYESRCEIIWTHLFFEYSHKNTGTRSQPCTWALNGTGVFGVPSVWTQHYANATWTQPERDLNAAWCNLERENAFSKIFLLVIFNYRHYFSHLRFLSF